MTLSETSLCAWISLLLSAAAHAADSLSNDTFLYEIVRSDGLKLKCEQSAFYKKFLSDINRYDQFVDLWSVDFMNNLTQTRPHFYYDRFQVVDGNLSLEQVTYWCASEEARELPKRYYAHTEEETLDYMKHLIQHYQRYIPNVDVLMLGQEMYYGYPSYFIKDYPIMRFENSNPDPSVMHWVWATREYVRPDVLLNFLELRENLLEWMDSKKLTPWPERRNKALFRGSVYMKKSMRYRLLSLYANNSDLGENLQDAWKYFDIKMTPLASIADHQVFTQHWDKVGMTHAEWLSHFDQTKYKFVVVIDGTVSPDRVAQELLYGGVMLKQVSKYQSSWAYELVPYEHFIPWYDEVDLVRKVKYYMDKIVIENDEETIRYLTNISLNGMKLALRKFDMEHNDCHAINMLQLYARTFRKTSIPSGGKGSLGTRKYSDKEVTWLHELGMNKSLYLNVDLSKYFKKPRWHLLDKASDKFFDHIEDQYNEFVVPPAETTDSIKYSVSTVLTDAKGASLIMVRVVELNKSYIVYSGAVFVILTFVLWGKAKSFPRVSSFDCSDFKASD